MYNLQNEFKYKHIIMLLLILLLLLLLVNAFYYVNQVMCNYSELNT